MASLTLFPAWPWEKGSYESFSNSVLTSNEQNSPSCKIDFFSNQFTVLIRRIFFNFCDLNP